MKLSRLTISQKLILVFTAIILLFTLISINIAIHINNSVESTKAIYRHPYIVSNSVHHIEQNTISLHRSLNEFLLTEDQAEYASIIDRIERLEADINKQFEVLFERYLGPGEDVENAYDSFKQWQNIKEDVFQLLDSNNFEQASEIIRSRGAEQSVLIISKIQVISDSADQKIIEFQNYVLNQQKIIIRNFIIFLLAVIIFSICSSLFITHSISSPLKKLISRIKELNLEDGDRNISRTGKDQMDLLNSAVDQLVSINQKLVQETQERLILQSELEEYHTSLEKLVEQKTAELNSANQLLIKSIDEAAIGIVSVGLEGCFLKVNKRFCNLIGYSSNELLTLNFQDITFPQDRPIGGNLVQDMLAGKIDKAEFSKRYLHKNGNLVHTKINTVLIRNEQNEPLYFFTQVQDITKQKQAETELKKHQAEQDQIIADKTSRYQDSQKALSYLLEDVNEMRLKLENTNEKLQDLNQELESFSYSVSHDLRAPLRAIEGFAKILQEDNWDMLNEEGKESIEIIINNSRIMNQLISDLLEYSRLERKKVRKSNIDTPALVKEVLMELNIKSRKDKLEIIFADLPPCQADHIQLKQVWQNLISNALKYSSTRAKIVIKIGGNIEADMTTFYVKDNGVGFDMKYQDKLFGVFQRLHSSDQFEGTGVGLAIVKKIISKHNGKTWATSELDKGAEFYFSLPLKK